MSTYSEHVRELESQLASYAFRSERIETFADGTLAIDALEERWARTEASLAGRTPLALERDRILYSNALRAESDKHHVLFWEQHRVARDYTTHTLRVAQVARSTAVRLSLNSDLAEAVALGSKVGAVPFIHVAKSKVADWIAETISSFDTSPSDVAPRSTKGTSARPSASQRRVPGPGQKTMAVTDSGELIVPSWIDDISSPELKHSVQANMPWAAGDIADKAYSSGQQSYWVLATEPFQHRVAGRYLPQTLYGIWRHGLPSQSGYGTFVHSITLPARDGSEVTLAFTEASATHEANLVRYADDITWVIENLSEANKAAAFSGGSRNTVYEELHRTLRNDAPTELSLAVANADPGGIYTYFIDSLVSYTRGRFNAGAVAVNEPEPSVGLTPTAGRMLSKMKDFLSVKVFSQTRTEYRNRVLADLSLTVLEVLRTSAQASFSLIERRGMEANWSQDDLDFAKERYSQGPVQAVQTSVDLLSSMSDREVYDLIGLD